MASVAAPEGAGTPPRACSRALRARLVAVGDVLARDAVLDAEADQRPRVIEFWIFAATVSVASSSASKASSLMRSAAVISCVGVSIADEPFEGCSLAPGCVSA